MVSMGRVIHSIQFGRCRENGRPSGARSEVSLYTQQYNQTLCINFSILFFSSLFDASSEHSSQLFLSVCGFNRYG